MQILLTHQHAHTQSPTPNSQSRLPPLNTSKPPFPPLHPRKECPQPSHSPTAPDRHLHRLQVVIESPIRVVVVIESRREHLFASPTRLETRKLLAGFVETVGGENGHRKGDDGEEGGGEA